MTVLRKIMDGWRGLFSKEEAEREMDEELREYLESATREKVRAGMSREQAQRAARVEFGGVENVKEEIRAVSWETFVEGLWRDLRFGCRLLASSPMFAAAAILSLALGIGANTAIFELINAVRLRTLPVNNPQEIVRIAIDKRRGVGGTFTNRYSDLTYAIWERIRAEQQGFLGVFAWAPNAFNISPGGEVHNVEGIFVSGEFFETLEVQPELGRLLTTADDQKGCPSRGVVISHAFWHREYGGDRSVIGRKITLIRQPFEIVGVAQASFYGVEVGRSFDVAAPLCAEPVMVGEYSVLGSRTGWWLSVMGRLKPGWTLERANTQLRAASPQIFDAAAPVGIDAGLIKNFLAFQLKAIPAQGGISRLREEFENPLWLLLALAGFVLLIASANLANLMLARASAREREMGLRLALGAGRARLVRQLLAESLLLATGGAVLGAAIARILGRVLVVSLSTESEHLFLDFRMDWRIFAFTMGLAALACALFGLVPALRATRVSPGITLKEAARGMTEGRSRFGFRRALVVAQIALSLVLVVGAFLFARSLRNISSVDAGFRQDGIVFTDIDFRLLKLEGDRRREFSRDLLQRIRQLPGVDAAAMVTIVPLSGNGMVHDIRLNDSDSTGSDDSTASFNDVSPGFFATMNTRLLEGRDFTERDAPGAPIVAIVNESFARKFAEGRNAVGTTFRVGRLGKMSSFYQIVGVAQDAKYYDLRETPQPTVYTSLAQKKEPDSDAQIVVRSNAPVGVLFNGIKGVADQAHPGMDMAFFTFHKMIQDGLLRERLMAKLSGFFGLLAVTLAIVGLYGVISYMVVRRRNEIGIRMALGANRTRVITMVMREALLLAGIGIPIGIGLALAAGKTAAAMLYGLKPWDAVTLGLAVCVLALVAASASFLPALRAARLEPMAALRDE